MTTENPWLLLRREEKARKLADVIHATGITAAMIAAANEEQARNFWKLATDGVNSEAESNGEKKRIGPPSEETRKLVLEMLAEREMLEANRANTVRARGVHVEAPRGQDSV